MKSEHTERSRRVGSRRNLSAPATGTCERHASPPKGRPCTGYPAAPAHGQVGGAARVVDRGTPAGMGDASCCCCQEGSEGSQVQCTFLCWAALRWLTHRSIHHATASPFPALTCRWAGRQGRHPVQAPGSGRWCGPVVVQGGGGQGLYVGGHLHHGLQAEGWCNLGRHKEAASVPMDKGRAWANPQLKR